MNRNLAVLTMFAGLTLALSSGCATKNHVRSQVSPVVDKVNELDDLTARNSNDIKDVDSRSQKGISDVNAKSAAADQKAQSAGQRAAAAQDLASQAANRAESLGNTVANLDNFKPVAQATVHFAFNKADLNSKSKKALDQLAADIPNTKGYILQLEGGTDSVGNAQYNYDLSKRRTAAVVQYLAQQYNVPAYKIFVIGLGEDKEVAPNKDSKGRAENRRVEIRLLSNVAGNDNNNTSAAVQQNR
jgi:outer membrane protein OmpA-like peptidoglycan-associated protein